jgi:hypothetical protein
MATTANGHSEKGAYKDIARFSTMYSAVVGAPSILAIIRAAFTEWRLTPVFQWIVDGYHQITAQLASYGEPYILLAITWINALLGRHLIINPIWRSVFLLLSIVGVAITRWRWSDLDATLWIRLRGSVRFFVIFVPLALVVAVLAGAVVDVLREMPTGPWSWDTLIFVMVTGGILFIGLDCLLDPIDTRAAVKSDWVASEADRARAAQKLIPLCAFRRFRAFVPGGFRAAIPISFRAAHGRTVGGVI